MKSQRKSVDEAQEAIHPSFSTPLRRAHGEPAAIRVVLFDLDDTLFAHRAAVATAIDAHVRALGPPFGSLDAASALALWNTLEDQHYHAYLAGELDYEGQRRARARDFAERHGVHLDEDGQSAWFEAYFERYVSAWTLHDDAIRCLDALEQAIPGVRFGLITNGDEAFQLRKVERVGLAPRMEHIVTSGAFGIAKPDPRIFQHACSLFGVSPAETVYVGDRLSTDAIGAANAGLTGIWIDRGNASTSNDLTAEYEELGVRRIPSLDGLVKALAPA